MAEYQAAQIGVGDPLPDLDGYLTLVTDQCVREDTCALTTTNEMFKEKKRCVIVGMPGAFTPTCTDKHLPGFIRLAPRFRRQGVDTVAVVTTNDKFIVSAWKDAMKGCLKEEGLDSFDSRLAMIADQDASLTKALGLAYYHKLDRSKQSGSWLQFTAGVRAKRFALVAEEGIVTYLAIEDEVMELDTTSAEAILGVLGDQRAAAVASGDADVASLADDGPAPALAALTLVAVAAAAALNYYELLPAVALSG